MLSEFVERLVGLGQDAKRVEFHTHDRAPQTLFIRHGDQLLEKDVPPPDRKHYLVGFDDLVAALADAAIAKDPEVYVAKDCVTALLDRAERRQLVCACLDETVRFQILRTLEQPRSMTVREAVKMLRFDLHGSNTDHVVQALRRIDFRRSSAGSTVVEHGKESLGRSVEAAVQQAEQVPEQFDVRVPIWKTPGFVHHVAQVTCGLYLDLDNEQIEIRVLSDEIDRVRSAGLRAAADELRKALGESVPVFQGAP